MNVRGEHRRGGHDEDRSARPQQACGVTAAATLVR